MKICFDARMVVGHHGIGQYTKNLIEGARAHGHEVVALVSKDETVNILGDEVETIKCRLPFAHPLESFELSFVAPKIKCDLFHFPSFAVPFLIPRRPTVVTIHDVIHLHHPKLPHRLYYNTVLKGFLDSHVLTIAVSEWTKWQIVSLLEVQPDRIVVVRNGLDKAWFDMENSTPLQTTPTLVCLTNLKAHKNLQTLLRACRDLWRQGFNFKLQLSLGGEDLPPQWENLKSKIEVLKNVSDDVLRENIKKAWAVVSPSRFEGYDYPVAQGLAQGKTIILSHGSAHDEFKSPQLQFYGEPNDVAGLADAIKTIIKKPPRPLVHHNVAPLEDMVRQTLAVYERAQK